MTGGDISKCSKHYRLIAFLGVLSKILESVVKDRLSYLLESCSCLSDCQKGFRHALSTEVDLWRFVTSASFPLKVRQCRVGVALDIKSAYVQ